MQQRLPMAAILASGLLIVSCSASATKGGLFAEGQAAAGMTPVQKVIQLMEKMMETCEEEKHQEEVQFAKYKAFCEQTSADRARSIKDCNERIEVLDADIEKYTATASKLTKEIAVLDEDMSVWKGDQEAATHVRELEKATYISIHKDLTESIMSLQEAIGAIKKMKAQQQQNRAKRGGSFIEVSSQEEEEVAPEFSPNVQSMVDSFMQSEEGRALGSAEDPKKKSSRGVMEIVEKLLDKFMTKRSNMEKKEMEGRHAYEELMQELKEQVAQGSNDREDKANTKARTLQSKADAESNRQDATSTRDADKPYLSDLVATCEQKANDFVTRQDLRSKELEAIQKAKEIISGSAVKGNADKHLPSLEQQAAQMEGFAFASLRAEIHSSAQTKVAQFLKKQAAHLDSKLLSVLALKVADDPLAKVKKMIKDLIVRLMEEANEEAEHKGWCDTEMASNLQTRKDKSESVQTLTAEIDQLKAGLAKLGEEITELTQNVAELEKAMTQATELREEEKKKNTKTIKDSQEAQTAVAQAMTVLKEFYDKAGENTALLQEKPEAPEVFDEPYKGMGGAKGGVVGLLEVIENDFARLEADTKAAESAADKEYRTFMSDSKVDKMSKSKDVEHKSGKKQDMSKTLTMKSEDLDATQKELTAALAYFDKLKPSCVDSGESFEDRVARRKEEIESLQEALRILNGEDMA